MSGMTMTVRLLRVPSLALGPETRTHRRLWLHELDPERRGSWRIHAPGDRMDLVVRVFPPLTTPCWWALGARAWFRPYGLYRAISK